MFLNFVLLLIWHLKNLLRFVILIGKIVRLIATDGHFF